MKIKAFFLVIIFGVLSKLICAQDRIVEGVSPNLYISHPVAAKETWYSLGRLYNLSPKELASFNKLSIDKPLDVAKAIKIPLTPSNFVQKDVRVSDNGYHPVYHIVQQKEWLYRIGLNHNKVPVQNLEKWNSITSDQARPGMKLIVGFLKTNGPLTSSPVAQTTESAPNAVQSNATTPASPAITQTPKGGSGFFRLQYSGQGRTSTGLSGIFKSTSGWDDGKYYALMNNMAVGTIVKIDLMPAGKTIYAKVLGELPDMKESVGLTLRISDAAATELGATGSRFNLQISY